MNINTNKLFALFSIFCIIIVFSFYYTNEKTKLNDKLISKLYPSDYFYQVRAYPFDALDVKAYKKALNEVNNLKKNNNNSNLRTTSSDWKLEGPKNIGGRINSIAVPSNSDSIIYVGCAKGGIFKTEDAGQNWAPIFDDQSFLAIGDIGIDPNNDNILYAGTGDVNISGSHYIGDGIYKSEDAGASWTNIGLAETGVVAEIIVPSQNSNIIYAATMGFPQVKDANRGLYKSNDGGLSWNQILFVNDSTGIVDIVIDPNDENIIYAASWVRFRSNTNSVIAGPSAKIFKSIDGGTNWTTLEGGLPYDSNNLIQDTLGRIGITIDPTNTDILYAQFASKESLIYGIYKSEDAGLNWQEMGFSITSSSFTWYFGKLRLNPYAPNKLFRLDVQLWKSEDDDDWAQNDPNWSTYEVHADKHDIYFIDANSYLLATDGGLYKTTDNGYTWSDIEDIPNSQFYHIKVNPHQINDYWGGMQDNGTSHGNEYNISNWPRTYGGDGFNVEFRKDDPNVIYAETQRGNIVVSTNGGSGFFNANDGYDDDDRTNWNTPFIVSNHDPNVLYRGSYRLYKSDYGAIPFWNAVSGDLTEGDNTDTYPPVISDINESPVDANVIYIGTTDGKLHISEDAGYSYTDISNGLPNFYLKDVEAGNDSNTVFVTHSGYFFNNYIPHVHVSYDKGANWNDISSNLPQIGVNDIEQHPFMDSLLFVATDGGVFYSEDFGGNWQLLGDNLPTVNIADVEIDTLQSKLVAGTFARSAWSFDISEIVDEAVQSIVLETNGDQTICEGDSVQLIVSGANTYSWNNESFLNCADCADPIVNVTTTTVFEVIACLVPSNCVTEQFTITVIPSPSIPTIDFDLSSSTLTAYDDGNFGQWYVGIVPIPGATSNTYEPIVDGNYSYASFNASNCEGIFSEELAVSISDIETYEVNAISIYPNPSKNYLNFESSHIFDEIFIYAEDGRLVIKEKYAQKIDIQNLSQGRYYIHFVRDSKTAALKNFIKI